MPPLNECNPMVFPDDSMSPEINHIAAAVVAMQATLEHATKDAVNPHFKSRYADLASCWTALKPHLTPNGLAVVQTVTLCRCESDECRHDGFVLRTLLVHAPSGQWFKSDLPLYPQMSDPQKVGSAITYARRYGLCAITGLYQDDDDANLASPAPNGTGRPTPARDDRYTPAATSTRSTPARAPAKNATEVRPFSRFMHEEALAAGMGIYALIEGVIEVGNSTGFIQTKRETLDDDGMWGLLQQVWENDRDWLIETAKAVKTAARV